MWDVWSAQKHCAYNLLDLPWASVDCENYITMLCSFEVLSSVLKSEIGKGENQPQMFAVRQSMKPL